MSKKGKGEEEEVVHGNAKERKEEEKNEDKHDAIKLMAVSLYSSVCLSICFFPIFLSPISLQYTSLFLKRGQWKTKQLT